MYATDILVSTRYKIIHWVCGVKVCNFQMEILVGIRFGRQVSTSVTISNLADFKSAVHLSICQN